MEDRAIVIAEAAQELGSDNFDRAAEILRSRYAFQPVNQISGGISRSTAVRVFRRDGFIDRYSGQRVVFPAALRAISVLLPEEFPHHPNWRMDACHFAYYELCAVVDHVKPRARGGTNEMDNLLTTSTLRNSAKANFTLQELGWRLLDDSDLDKWDGLMEWFFKITERMPELLEVSDIAGWAGAAREVLRG